jgi:large-conductance mechanosensitive channel
MKDFLKTLLWHDLLPLALAVYFGTVLQAFLESLVNHILVPLFDYIVAAAFGKLHLYDKDIINLREFTTQTITLIIACVLLYCMIKILMKYVESKK